MDITNAGLKNTLQRKMNALMEYIEGQKEALDLNLPGIDSADLVLELYGKDAIRAPRPGEAKIPVPFVNHYKRCRIDTKDLPDYIVVKLYGLGFDRSILFDKHHSLNGTYDATTTTAFIVEDPNDVAFFINKAITNPELYKIVEPEGFLEKYLEKQKPIENTKPTPAPATQHKARKRK